MPGTTKKAFKYKPTEDNIQYFLYEVSLLRDAFFSNNHP
jgi:hypothetical protein